MVTISCGTAVCLMWMSVMECMTNSGTELCFPIMDVNNRVIGFGGRVMGDGKPKYLNSPETKIFDKSRNLYGLNVARTSRKHISDPVRRLYGCDLHASVGLYQRSGVPWNLAYFRARQPSKALHPGGAAFV